MLELKNIQYNIHKSERELLRNFSYKFEPGKNYIITGANGCGKSTLAKIITGIITPTAGDILFNGRNINDLDITERAKLGIGYAFQQPVRFKGLKTKDLLINAFGGKIDTAKACDYLSKVGLCAREYLNRELDSSLSGGELKRIEIASVLARECPLNIFDEPEAGIDLWSFNNLVNIFKNSINDKKTNIIISHQEKLFKSADEILVIADGEIIMSGKPKNVLPQISTLSTCKRLKDEVL